MLAPARQGSTGADEADAAKPPSRSEERRHPSATRTANPTASPTPPDERFVISFCYQDAIP